MTRSLLILLMPVGLVAGCSHFSSTVTERKLQDGSTERVTRVNAGTFFDSKSELSKLTTGQTDKTQRVAIGSLSQESSGSNVVGFAESVVGAAVRAAVKP